MPVKLIKILDFVNENFDLTGFNDPSLNGLQVESTEDVHKIGAAVDFSASTLDKAIEEKVNLLITHHGMIWNKTNPITGDYAKKIKSMLDHKVNLIGLHLPLDAHETFGNNIIIAREILKLSDIKPSVKFGEKTIGFVGQNDGNLDLDKISKLMGQTPGALKQQTILEFGPKIPKRICVVSGAAADALFDYKTENFDTLITGEPRQFAYHFCKENKLNAIFSGHYSTETHGVRALSEHLSKMYNIPWVFIDEPTGI